MIYLNGTPVRPTLFPDGTSQVWQLDGKILKETNYAHVVWEFAHEAEFMHLAQLKQLLDAYSFNTCLRLTYLPYGRQDKNIENGSTFALHTFALLLNSLHFDEVVCMDPHSNIAERLIANFRATYPLDQLQHVLGKTESDLVCYPDLGARTKYKTVYATLVPEFIFGEKVRDPLTGHITQYSLFGNPDKRRVLIVDDLVDGGGTFSLLAKSLLEAGASEVSLFATHGIFSKGLRPLKEAGIKHIFCPQGEAFQDHRSQSGVSFERF